MGRPLYHVVKRLANAIACSAGSFKSVPKDAWHSSLRITLKSNKALKTSPQCTGDNVSLRGYLSHISPYQAAFTDGSGSANVGGLTRKGGRKNCQAR